MLEEVSKPVFPAGRLRQKNRHKGSTFRQTMRRGGLILGSCFLKTITVLTACPLKKA
jgi:hypothetical protein